MASESNVSPIAVLRYLIDDVDRGEPHFHDDHQLVWSPDDSLAVEVDARCWMLPPTQALFVPAGVVHATSPTSPHRDAIMVGIHLSPQRCPLTWTDPTVIAVSPMLRELLLFQEARAAPGPDPTTQHHVEALIYELAVPVATSLSLPMPDDERARRVAERFLENPADQRTLHEWAHDAGSSVRTLSRLFVEQTGMPFGQWRNHARIGVAMSMLTRGLAVKRVARSVGYSTPSAFTVAFRRVAGATPAIYVVRAAAPDSGN